MFCQNVFECHKPGEHFQNLNFFLNFKYTTLKTVYHRVFLDSTVKQGE